MSDTNFSGQSIAQLATGLREGRLKARDLAEAAIDAQTRLEPALNAYRDWNPDYTRAQADAADAAFAARFDLRWCGTRSGMPDARS